MLQTTETLTERDMTMPVVVALYLKAAYRKKQQHTGLDEALAESAPPSEACTDQACSSEACPDQAC